MFHLWYVKQNGDVFFIRRSREKSKWYATLNEAQTVCEEWNRKIININFDRIEAEKKHMKRMYSITRLHFRMLKEQTTYFKVACKDFNILETKPKHRKNTPAEMLAKARKLLLHYSFEVGGLPR